MAMTVMVTGASGFIGRALVHSLVATDAQIRCAVRSSERAEELRALGAKVTVGRLEDADQLAEVLRGIATIVHLVGGPNQPSDDELFSANHRSTLVALEAARAAGVRRFLFVSTSGARPDSENRFLRAKGLAEEAVAAAGLDHLILRCTHVYGLGGLWFAAAVQGATASPPVVVGDGTQSLAPVFADDVVEVLAAADARAEPLVGTYGLEGPDVISADGLVELLAGAGVAPEHLLGEEAAARLTGMLGISVTRAAAEWLALPSRADAPDAAAALGVRRTPLVEGLRATLARAADG
jgi:NADH dehydrogenase